MAGIDDGMLDYLDRKDKRLRQLEDGIRSEVHGVLTGPLQPWEVEDLRQRLANLIGED